MKKSELKRLIEIWRKDADQQWDNEGIGMHEAAAQLERYLSTGDLPPMPADPPPPMTREESRRLLDLATKELIDLTLARINGWGVDHDVRKPVAYKTAEAAERGGK